MAPLQLITKRGVGMLSEAEGRQLQAWINRSPDNAREYAIETQLEWAMRDALRAKPTPAVVRNTTHSFPATDNRPPLLSSPTARWSLAAAAVLLIAFGWLGSTRRPAARLVASVAAEWGGDKPSISGGLTNRQTIELRSGLVQVEFANGAQVVIEGPAGFEVIGRRELRLRSGKATASCRTKETHGFTIRVPEGRVVDLGTEFGVATQAAGGSTVYVFEGEVQLFGDKTTGARTRVVRAGQAATFGEPAPPVFTPEFCTLQDFRVAAGLDQGTIPANWKGFYDRLRNDPDLLFWSDFSRLEEGSLPENLSRFNDDRSRLLNTGPGIPDLPLVDGRHSPNAALACRSAGSLSRIRVPGVFRSLTLAAWVYLEPQAETTSSHRGLLLSDWGLSGQVHWQVKNGGPRLSFPIEGDEGHASYQASSPSSNSLAGQWRLLATVFDGNASGEVSHYIDGALVDRQPIDADPPLLRLGDCTIGGWDRPNDPRELDGAIDDLWVWRRALSPAEIARLAAESRLP